MKKINRVFTKVFKHTFHSLLRLIQENRVTFNQYFIKKVIHQQHIILTEIKINTQEFFGKLSLLIFNSRITDSNFPAHTTIGVHALNYKLYLGLYALSDKLFSLLPYPLLLLILTI